MEDVLAIRYAGVDAIAVWRVVNLFRETAHAVEESIYLQTSLQNHSTHSPESVP